MVDERRKHVSEEDGEHHTLGIARVHHSNDDGNGANEEAVAMFLNDKIGFYDIYRLVNAAASQVPFIADPTLEQILEADRLARETVRANS